MYNVPSLATLQRYTDELNQLRAKRDAAIMASDIELAKTYSDAVMKKKGSLARLQARYNNANEEIQS